MTRGEAIYRLRNIRLELQTLDGWPKAAKINPAELLKDICEALEFTDAEQYAIIGARATEYLDNLHNSRVCPTVPD